jgi:hypothetical protein
MNELEKQKTRFYKLTNGLLAIGYIAVFAFILAEVYSMIF